MNTTGARVTFVENIYFQMPGEQPIEISPGRATEYNVLTDSEEPYTRRYKLNSDPIPIDFGWLEKNPGMLHVRNLSPTGTIKIIDNSQVPPLQTAKMWPDWNKQLFLCADTELTAYITILPE